MDGKGDLTGIDSRPNATLRTREKGIFAVLALPFLSDEELNAPLDCGACVNICFEIRGFGVGGLRTNVGRVDVFQAPSRASIEIVEFGSKFLSSFTFSFSKCFSSHWRRSEARWLRNAISRRSKSWSPS